MDPSRCLTGQRWQRGWGCGCCRRSILGAWPGEGLGAGAAPRHAAGSARRPALADGSRLALQFKYYLECCAPWQQREAAQQLAARLEAALEPELVLPDATGLQRRPAAA
jgi:hypothetical protein